MYKHACQWALGELVKHFSLNKLISDMMAQVPFECLVLGTFGIASCL